MRRFLASGVYAGVGLEMTSAGTSLPASSLLLGTKLSHGDGLGIAKAALLHARGVCFAAAVAGGDAVAEAGAGHHATNALGAACAVAGAGSGGQIKGSRRRDIDRAVVGFTRGNAVRIAEATGLNVFRGLRNRGQG